MKERANDYGPSTFIGVRIPYDVREKIAAAASARDASEAQMAREVLATWKPGPAPKVKCSCPGRAVPAVHRRKCPSYVEVSQ